MTGETLAGLAWLLINVTGLSISLRAVIRGARRLKGSGDPVSTAVHMAELATGALFFVVFLLSASTAVVSLYILPPDTANATMSAYEAQRVTTLRWMLIGEKVLSIVIVLIPEALDRYLTAYARRDGNP